MAILLVIRLYWCILVHNSCDNYVFRQWVKTNTKCEGKLVRVQTFSALLCHILLVLQEDSGQLSKVQRMEVQYVHSVFYLER